MRKKTRITRKDPLVETTKVAQAAPAAPDHGNVDTGTQEKKPFRSNLPRDPLTGQLLPRQKDTREPQSLSEATAKAFQKVGGARWLRKMATKDPKGFMSLLARVSDDTGGFGGATYVPLVVPVEQREKPGGELEPLDPLM